MVSIVAHDRKTSSFFALQCAANAAGLWRTCHVPENSLDSLPVIKKFTLNVLEYRLAGQCNVPDELNF